MRSEEISELNKAMKYCSEPEVDLEGTLQYLQRLNRKYNPKKSMDTLTTSMEGMNRSPNDIKQVHNTINVRIIKVRREVEVALTRLKHIREKQ